MSDEGSFHVKRIGLRAPFPWFGGKSRAASLVWERLGDVLNYCEPFFGSGAILLSRPTEPGIETVNDKDGFVCNVWRALQAAPDEVAYWADSPVNGCDLTARHVWLIERREKLSVRLESDPDYFDAKIAGWWLWGISCWIGGGWCSGQGPWHSRDGYLVRAGADGETRTGGVSRSKPYLGSRGMGVQRQMSDLHSKDISCRGPAPGVNQWSVGWLPGGGKETDEPASLIGWFRALQQRLRRVRVCCGDWTSILGPTPTILLGLTGVVLDPPYDLGERHSRLYTEDAEGLSASVREWAIAHGDEPLLRIVLCGYEGEHEMPVGWEKVKWSTGGGYGNQGERRRENRYRERLWFSPHCLKPDRARQVEFPGWFA